MIIIVLNFVWESIGGQTIELNLLLLRWKAPGTPAQRDWICNLNIIMGWVIKSLRAHGTFVVNFIVAEDIGPFPQREEYPIGI